MKRVRFFVAALALAALGGSLLVVAQQPPAQAPPQPMTFFITSAGPGNGANLGGIAGADAHCQKLAAAANRGGATWRAYLSTQGPGAVNARDRIGAGPWHNFRGVRIAQSVGELHGDTIEQARLGVTLGRGFSLTEKGTPVPGVGETPNQHDILTGTMPDGRAFTDTNDHTCGNWSSNTSGSGSAQVGHHDKQGGGNGSWNSAHPSRGCSQENLVATGGAGLLYCFATN